MGQSPRGLIFFGSGVALVHPVLFIIFGILGIYYDGIPRRIFYGILVGINGIPEIQEIPEIHGIPTLFTEFRGFMEFQQFTGVFRQFTEKFQRL